MWKIYFTPPSALPAGKERDANWKGELWGLQRIYGLLRREKSLSPIKKSSPGPSSTCTSCYTDYRIICFPICPETIQFSIFCCKKSLIFEAVLLVSRKTRLIKDVSKERTEEGDNGLCLYLITRLRDSEDPNVNVTGYINIAPQPVTVSMLTRCSFVCFQLTEWRIHLVCSTWSFCITSTKGREPQRGSPLSL
jgi:hypothetical protein